MHADPDANVDVHPLRRSDDWPLAEELLRAVWLEREPYAWMDPDTVGDHFDETLERSRSRLFDPPGAIAFDSADPVGVLLVADSTQSKPWSSPMSSTAT